MRLYLGEARDVVCTRTIEDNQRHPVRGNLFDQEIRIKYEIENFKDKPVTLDIVEQLNRLAPSTARDPHGDVEWELGGARPGRASASRTSRAAPARSCASTCPRARRTRTRRSRR